ncbi:MAG: hypothetical protein ACTIDO_17030 [Brevibacterium aurantiacum]|uniref:hypothetical protein n=1 Tax=Brevibacterium aurantiacum TaxID=273384 RepID=UPI003F903611
MSYQAVLRGNIKAAMARRDWLGQRTAEAIGLTPALFSSRLHGRTEWRLSELVNLALALEVPFGRLVDGIDAELGASA